MDFARIARELLVAIRGHRSQTAFSRWLGYRSNVVYSWEAGRRWPTGAEFFRVCQRAGVDVVAALERVGFRATRTPLHKPDLDVVTEQGSDEVDPDEEF